MRRISLFIVINAISLYIVSVLMKSVYIGSLASLITLTIIFGLLNLIVKPVIEFFSLPLSFLTLCSPSIFYQVMHLGLQK